MDCLGAQKYASEAKTPAILHQKLLNMQNFKTVFFILIGAINFVLNGQSITPPQKKVLMVVSSYGNGKSRPGFELDEVSQAYLIFKENRLKVEMASPKGGKVASDKYNAKKLYNALFLQDKEAAGLLDNTISTAKALEVNDYDVIYIAGGKGAMFDLPYDPSLQDLILSMYNKKNLISAVCHGSAALLHIKTNDTTYLVKDKMITGLCNEEETKFGKKWIKEFPYLLETKMIERGAKYKREEIMLPYILSDGNVVTGQNPFSTTQLAEEVVKSLGIIPKPRTLYAEEKSLNLVKRALNNEYDWAMSELKKDTSGYNLELIAVYGYYGLTYAGDNKDELIKGLKIIDLVVPYYFNEQMQLERAKAYLKLGNTETGKKLLKELINKNLLVDEANKLLNKSQ